jgi:hypothetical protein
LNGKFVAFVLIRVNQVEIKFDKEEEEAGGKQRFK